MRGVAEVVGIVGVLVLAVPVPVSAGGPPVATPFASHAPLLIEGDANFTAANGVTGGIGTPASPFLIEGWSIDAPTGTGIDVRNTSAPFVVRDVNITCSSGGLARHLGVNLTNVENARFERIAIGEPEDGILLHEIRNVTFEGVSVHIATWSGSSFLSGSDLQDLRIDSATFLADIREGLVHLSSGRNVTISRSTLDNQVGIIAFDVEDSVFEGNWINETQQGLTLVNMTRLAVQRNQFSGGGYGVILSGCHNVTVVENVFLGADQAAIHTDRDDRRPERLPTDDLAAFHNSFDVLPARPYVTGTPYPEHARWDDGYPSGGNYWSRYGGADRCRGAAQADCSNRDGIGDTPYGNITEFSSSAEDRYPLVRAFPLPTEAPTAFAVATPSTGDSTIAFLFDASGSRDPRDPVDALEVRWAFDGSTTGDWTTQKTVEHRFFSAGTHVVVVTVRNTAGLQATHQLEVTVTDPWYLWPSVAGLLLIPAVVVAAYVLLRRRRADSPAPPDESSARR